ncbi:MAG: hypothetical protein ACLP8X_19410, partial [Streptosporangiaceae bacterium]
MRFQLRPEDVTEEDKAHRFRHFTFEQFRAAMVARDPWPRCWPNSRRTRYQGARPGARHPDLKEPALAEPVPGVGLEIQGGHVAEHQAGRSQAPRARHKPRTACGP